MTFIGLMNKMGLKQNMYSIYIAHIYLFILILIDTKPPAKEMNGRIMGGQLLARFLVMQRAWVNSSFR